MDKFDWRHPNFSASVTGESVYPASPYTNVQVAKRRTRDYVRNAPKKTLRKKPRNNTQRYVWDNGMTFEEKAGMLANGDLRNHVRRSAFIDDLDRYATPAEQIMDWLENASPNTQRYYGVYEDIMARKNAQFKPVYDSAPASGVIVGHVPGVTVAPHPAASRRRSNNRPVQNAAVPMPTIEPEPIVDSTPLDVTDTTARDWGLWNPTTAMASYQADAGLRRAAMAPVQQVPLAGVNVPQYGWGGWLMPICPK